MVLCNVNSVFTKNYHVSTFFYFRDYYFSHFSRKPCIIDLLFLVTTRKIDLKLSFFPSQYKPSVNNFFLSAAQKGARDDYASDVMAENVNYAGGKGHFCQLNSLWSVWYGLLATVLNVYSVLLATRRLSGMSIIYI